MGGMTIARRGIIGAAAGLVAAPRMAWSAEGKPRVAMQTHLGLILLELEPDKAPLTTANFLRYAEPGRHDGAHIFRASRTEGAETTGLIEGRLSTNTTKLFPPIPHESTLKTGLKHLDGTISMARGAKGTARVDFFICCGPAPYLDADPTQPGDNEGYAAFGAVVEGLEVAHAILALPTPGVAHNPAMKGQILAPPVAITSLKKVA